MAIKAIWGFAHLPKLDTLGAAGAGYGLAWSSYQITPYVQSYTTLYITAAGGIQLSTQNVGLPVYFTVPASAITNGVAKKSYFGFKLFNSGRTATNTGCIQIAGRSFLNLNVDNAPVGDAYYEFCVDRVAETITIKINGIVKQVISDSVAAKGYNGTNTLLFGFPSNPGNFGYLIFSNFYFLDDTEDDTPCSWLGEVIATPVTLAAAEGVSWTTPAADLKTGLNTIFTTGASLTTPTAKSPSTVNTPLVMDLVTSAPAAAKIHAIAFYGTIKKETSNVSLLKNELTIDNTTIQGNYVSPPDNSSIMGYSYPFGIFHRAPGAVQWSTGLINRTKWTLTPSSSAG